MKQKLVITFDEAMTAKYLELAGQKIEAEINADCCPSGVSLEINFGPFGDSATFLSGNRRIEIGEVNVELIEVK